MVKYSSRFFLVLHKLKRNLYCIHSDVFFISSKYYKCFVQTLWGLNNDEMHAVLTCSRTFTKGEEIKRNYSKLQAVGQYV